METWRLPQQLQSVGGRTLRCCIDGNPVAELRFLKPGLSGVSATGTAGRDVGQGASYRLGFAILAPKFICDQL
jgi:hypothetical protein